jgi:hypothetical protein
MHMAGWQGWLADRVGDSTRAHYLAHVRALIPEGNRSGGLGSPRP